VVIGPRLWSDLPAEISVMDCPRTFKRVLTEWCLERPDRPPVAGYQRTDDNSLLWVFQLSVYAGPELDEPDALRQNLSLNKEGRQIRRS